MYHELQVDIFRNILKGATGFSAKSWCLQIMALKYYTEYFIGLKGQLMFNPYVLPNLYDWLCSVKQKRCCAELKCLSHYLLSLYGEKMHLNGYWGWQFLAFCQKSSFCVPRMKVGHGERHEGEEMKKISIFGRNIPLTFIFL